MAAGFATNKYRTEIIDNGRQVRVHAVHGPLRVGETCLEEGQFIDLPRLEAECYLEKHIDLDGKKNCNFSRYCLVGDINAVPSHGFKNSYFVSAGTAKTIQIPMDADPNAECQYPTYAAFTLCGSCFWVNYGTADEPVVAVVDPTTGDIEDGSAADMNPTIRYLMDECGNQVTELSLFALEDAVVQIEFYRC